MSKGTPLPKPLPTAREMAEGDLMALVSKRFCAPEWAFLTQVRNGTGYKRQGCAGPGHGRAETT